MRTHKRFIVDWPLHRPDPVEQPPLPLCETPAGEPSLGERFAAFHRANPQVYRRLHNLARARAAAGERRISVKGLYEELRREGPATNGSDSPWRLDNSFTRCYADLLAADPELESRIERRRRHVE